MYDKILRKGKCPYEIIRIQKHSKTIDNTRRHR
jgi:hypothetical protein